MTPRKSCFIVFLAFFIYFLSCLNPLWCDDSFEKQAYLARRKGFKAQREGNYSRALSFYQKAVELDPNYAVVYNDLGIIYEKTNLPDKALEAYKKAIELDPQYVAAYTNIALFYEKNKDYEEAARMWQRRIVLGDAFDTWTLKAREHLEALSKIDKRLYKIYEESQILELIDEVKGLKSKIKDSSQLAAEVYFARGRKHYERGEYLKALRELHRATNLDPRNKEVEELLIKAGKRVLISP